MTAVIVGAQWGDEGKGKIVDVLSESFQLVARYAGGHNAGHTVIINGKKFVLQLVPCGVLRAGCRSVIGNGVVLDPLAFLKEVGALRAAGVQVDGNLFVSNRAQVILPYHRMIELAAENAPGRVKIGTTSRGIGPARRQDGAPRAAGGRSGLTAAEEDIENAVREKNTRLRTRCSTPNRSMPTRCIRNTRRRRRRLPVCGGYRGAAESGAGQGESILFERAGTMLDIDHGTYPFVTSSSATSAGR
jgi:adenylosuccinate synthase